MVDTRRAGRAWDWPCRTAGRSDSGRTRGLLAQGVGVLGAAGQGHDAACGARRSAPGQQPAAGVEIQHPMMALTAPPA